MSATDEFKNKKLARISGLRDDVDSRFDGVPDVGLSTEDGQNNIQIKQVNANPWDPTFMKVSFLVQATPYSREEVIRITKADYGPVIFNNSKRIKFFEPNDMYDAGVSSENNVSVSVLSSGWPGLAESGNAQPSYRIGTAVTFRDFRPYDKINVLMRGDIWVKKDEAWFCGKVFENATPYGQFNWIKIINLGGVSQLLPQPSLNTGCHWKTNESAFGWNISDGARTTQLTCVAAPNEIVVMFIQLTGTAYSNGYRMCRLKGGKVEIAQNDNYRDDKKYLRGEGIEVEVVPEAEHLKLLATRKEDDKFNVETRIPAGDDIEYVKSTVTVSTYRPGVMMRVQEGSNVLVPDSVYKLVKDHSAGLLFSFGPLLIKSAEPLRFNFRSNKQEDNPHDLDTDEEVVKRQNVSQNVSCVFYVNSPGLPPFSWEQHAVFFKPNRMFCYAAYNEESAETPKYYNGVCCGAVSAAWHDPIIADAGLRFLPKLQQSGYLQCAPFPQHVEETTKQPTFQENQEESVPSHALLIVRVSGLCADRTFYRPHADYLNWDISGPVGWGNARERRLLDIGASFTLSPKDDKDIIFKQEDKIGDDLYIAFFKPKLKIEPEDIQQLQMDFIGRERLSTVLYIAPQLTMKPGASLCLSECPSVHEFFRRGFETGSCHHDVKTDCDNPEEKEEETAEEGQVDSQLLGATIDRRGCCIIV